MTNDNGKFRLADATVAIVGLGLMGGSFALALRDKKLCRHLIAIDSDPGTRARAGEHHIAAYASLDAIAAADLIVLGMPVRTILTELPRIGDIARPGAIVMDLGSTKMEIVQAMEQLPAHVQPIGAHPMCGKETAGFYAAEAKLFQGTVFALTPLARTQPEIVTLISALITDLGARPIILDPERHDRIVAAISHLPFAVAAALMLAVDGLASEDDLVLALAASGFRDTSRLAASDTKMMLDIMMTNSANIAEMMRAYAQRFTELAQLIEQRDENALRQLLPIIAEKRREMIWAHK